MVSDKHIYHGSQLQLGYTLVQGMHDVLRAHSADIEVRHPHKAVVKGGYSNGGQIFVLGRGSVESQPMSELLMVFLHITWCVPMVEVRISLEE